MHINGKKACTFVRYVICIVLRSKSLIKPIRARIDVRRKGNEATQRFLKNNLAQLLANRHYVKAYDKVKILILCFPLDYSLCSLFSDYRFQVQSSVDPASFRLSWAKYYKKK